GRIGFEQKQPVAAWLQEEAMVTGAGAAVDWRSRAQLCRGRRRDSGWFRWCVAWSQAARGSSVVCSCGRDSVIAGEGQWCWSSLGLTIREEAGGFGWSMVVVSSCAWNRGGSVECVREAGAADG
ncbi:hypothetical protein TorRG33x02_155710, partial [Trema orientale]